MKHAAEAVSFWKRGIATYLCWGLAGSYDRENVQSDETGGLSMLGESSPYRESILPKSTSSMKRVFS